ncbi:MAG TPA: YggS family pyridoxal phosphate enzyme [Acidimicrobiales bacterium]|nr:YggS family pyridoxal phosphate enzyme [Acidimicrobiales bacterium]
MTTPVPPLEVVAARLAEVRRRIERAGGDPAALEVVAVTKTFPPAAVEAALALGLRRVGENYPAELVAKAAAFAPGTGPQWQFLGAIQRRRVARLAPVVSCWQTVSRLAEGETLARHAPGATVLVEVETTGLPGRNGAVPAAVPALVAGLRALGLDVAGLMTVAPPGGPEAARPAFATTARLGAELGLGELSMGISDDLEAAVSEGSTMVRVGRALFGARSEP